MAAEGVAGYTSMDVVVTEDMMREARALAGVVWGNGHARVAGHA